MKLWRVWMKVKSLYFFLIFVLARGEFATNQQATNDVINSIWMIILDWDSCFRSWRLKYLTGFLLHVAPQWLSRQNLCNVSWNRSQTELPESLLIWLREIFTYNDLNFSTEHFCRSRLSFIPTSSHSFQLTTLSL